MRTAFGLITLLSLGALACSSKAIDKDDDQTGGSTAGGMTSGTGGKTSTAGSAGSDTGGVVGRAGSTSTAGTPSTGGTTGGTGAGECADTAIMCVDADTASVCDPLTGETDVANCKDEYAKDGLVSNGCTADETGTGCTLDGLADADCQAGTPAFAVCADLTEDDLLNVYVNCFHDTEMLAHMVVTCYADYVDEAAQMVDCAAADAACVPPADM